MHPDDYRNKEDSKAVYWYSSPYDALNNWSAHQVEVHGEKFPTLEHAYHFSKFYENNPKIAESIRQAKSAWEAKQIATKNEDKNRADWFDVNLDVMEDLFRKKVEQNLDVRDILLKTGSRKICENSPVDSFWGLGKDGDGKNHMGQIQMKVRSEIRGK